MNKPGSAGESVLSFLLYVLRVFTTRIWVFVGVVAVVLALMAYTTLRSMPIYRATGVILIERQQSNLKNLDDPLQINTSDQDYYNTQVKILQGLGLADRVAERLLCKRCWTSYSIAEDRLVAPYACAKCGDPVQTIRSLLGDDAAEQIAGPLDVVLARANRIVDISYEHADRFLAAALVNAVIKAYEEDTKRRRMDSINRLHEEMMNQLDSVRGDRESSEKEVIEFYATHGLYIGDELTSTLQRLMHEASTALLQEERELARLDAVADQLSKAGDDAEKIRAVALAHNLLGANSSLDDQLAVARKDLAAAAQEFGLQHQQYKQASARVDELKKKLDEQTQLLAQGILAQKDVRTESVRQLRAKLDDLKLQRQKQDRELAEAETKRRVRDANRTLYDALNLRAKEARISGGLETTNIHVLRDASAPRRPVRPSLLFNMMIGLVVALISGAAAIVMLDRIDNTVRTTMDVEEVHDLPVLSVVPEAKLEGLSGPAALACWKDEHTQIAEALRRVRAAILLSVRASHGGPIRQILVASPGPDEGKTITSVNLAISLAQMGERTLLLDADFYRSESHRFFGLDREKGLSTLLVSDVALSQVIQPTPVPFLDYMATGLTPPQPASLLGSARMAWVLQEATRTYDRIVIDTAPLVAVTDATLLAPHADATLLVVRDGKTSKTALHRSLQTLTRIGVRPLGFVFNGARTGVGEFYFRYHHPSYEMEGDAARQTQQQPAPTGQPNP